MRLEAELDRVVACGNRHTPEGIVYPAIIRLFTIDERIPAFAIVDFTKHGKLVGLCRKGIIYLIVQVFRQPDRSRTIGHRRKFHQVLKFLLDDSGVSSGVGAVQCLHFFVAVLYVTDSLHQPAWAISSRLTLATGLAGRLIFLDKIFCVQHVEHPHIPLVQLAVDDVLVQPQFGRRIAPYRIMKIGRLGIGKGVRGLIEYSEILVRVGVDARIRGAGTEIGVEIGRIYKIIFAQVSFADRQHIVRTQEDQLPPTLYPG